MPDLFRHAGNYPRRGRRQGDGQRPALPGRRYKSAKALIPAAAPAAWLVHSLALVAAMEQAAAMEQPLQYGFEEQSRFRLHSRPVPPPRACGPVCGSVIAAIPRRSRSMVRPHNPQKPRPPRRSAQARRLPKPRPAQHRLCVPGRLRLMTAVPGQRPAPSSFASFEIPRLSEHRMATSLMSANPLTSS